MEKIYRVQMNSKGMPNFSTAVEVADRLTWIPCSEGLPKQDGRYLCTVGAAYRNPREMYYAPKDLATETDENTWRDTDEFYVHNWFVEAWMPIPEPWRGADDE